MQLKQAIMASPLKPYKFSQYCRKTPAVCLVNLITEQFVL
ncbi:hypothetical protein B4099_3487 [Heyndrickxia coagulans]|uniref:Uncharacterized protein n=1 Tax=Heyndrickxia coagulans TaxID=1398 RepID=A0A150K8F7_HEYCO|nr:hypothetical protein B4099_3487 [Heyndrickxia coagulans]